MEPKEFIKTISIPFRMYNTEELDLNTYIFTLSFDANLKNCDVSTARKVVTLGLEKQLLILDKTRNLLRAHFGIWDMDSKELLPPGWSPKFINLEKVAMVDLAPVSATIAYNPRPVERLKKVAPMEMEPLFISQTPKAQKTKKIEEEEEQIAEELPKPEIPEVAPAKLEEEAEGIEKERKRPTSKKKEAKKQEKIKGQKSIQDFFK
jgi:hypothetical protein